MLSLTVDWSQQFLWKLSAILQVGNIEPTEASKKELTHKMIYFGELFCGLMENGLSYEN